MSGELDKSVSLSGRVIVVTGAARGLGLAFAEAAAAAGAAEVVMADIDGAAGEKAAHALRDRGFSARFYRYDQSDPASIGVFGEQIARDFPVVDGLVNNAALATGVGGKSHADYELELWDRVMDINVRGLWLVTRALGPLLTQSARGGRIVNIASDTALWGAPNLLAYVASKGAVISMTRSLARELGKDNIAVNAVAPGLVLTESTEYVPEQRHRLYVEGRAIPRAQTPNDVVGLVLFLLSNAAGFVTGQTVPVNGGFVLN